MFATRVYHYRQPAAVVLGLKELRKQGLTPRGLLFIAVDPRGETHIVVPEDLDAVESIRVGDKLTLVSPLEGRYFHFDAVHRLPGDRVLWNGTRSPAQRHRQRARGRGRGVDLAQEQLGQERLPRLHAARPRLVVGDRPSLGGHRAAQPGLPRLRRRLARHSRPPGRRSAAL